MELWHREAEHWKTLYQKGMRVLVEGRTVRDEWEDADENGASRSRSRPGAWASCRTASSRWRSVPNRSADSSSPIAAPQRAAVATVIRPRCTSELSPRDSSRLSRAFQPPSRNDALAVPTPAVYPHRCSNGPPANRKAVSAPIDFLAAGISWPRHAALIR